MIGSLFIYTIGGDGVVPFDFGNGRGLGGVFDFDFICLWTALLEVLVSTSVFLCNYCI